MVGLQLHHLLLCCLMMERNVQLSRCWLIQKRDMPRGISISKSWLCHETAWGMHTVNGVLSLSQQTLQKRKCTCKANCNGPQDRPAAGGASSTQSDPTQSAQVIFADGDAAQGTSPAHSRKRGRLCPRRQSAKAGVAKTAAAKAKVVCMTAWIGCCSL